jgi:predicted nucleic acid-binding Zn ribbon protein
MGARGEQGSDGGWPVSALIREATDYDPEKSEPVGKVLKRWVTKSGLLKASDRQRVWSAWQRLLGSDATHTSLEGLRNNTASFTVDSSALLSELNNFRKQELLEGLRREVKSYFVRDIRLRLEKRRPPTGGGAKP